MKKILPIFLILVLIISGLGAVAISEDDDKHIRTSISFSNLSIKENIYEISIEMDGADSVFMKKDYYMVPKNIQTYTFPFGTEIIDIGVYPTNIQAQRLTKKLAVTPDPVLLPARRSSRAV